MNRKWWAAHATYQRERRARLRAVEAERIKWLALEQRIKWLALKLEKDEENKTE